MTATAAELLDAIETRLASPMVTYKENATEDAPRLAAALEAVLRLIDAERVDHSQHHGLETCSGAPSWNEKWARDANDAIVTALAGAL